MGKFQSGDAIHFLPMTVQCVNGAMIDVPSPAKFTHLMFRRFAGCPICNIGLRNYLTVLGEVEAASVQPFVIFHSSADETLRFQSELPIPIIPDPDRKLYKLFGVGASFWSVGNPRTWLPAICEIMHSGLKLPTEKQNPFVLPADFLIDRASKIVACKYASHAADVWTAQDVLRLADRGVHLRSSD